MPPGIPDQVPDEIALRVYERFGTMKALSRACGLEYHTVHSILTRSSQNALAGVIHTAKALNVAPEDLIDVFFEQDSFRRQRSFDALMERAQVNSFNELSKKSGIARSTISRYLLSDYPFSQLSAVIDVAGALELDLTKFFSCYQKFSAAS